MEKQKLPLNVITCNKSINKITVRQTCIYTQTEIKKYPIRDAASKENKEIKLRFVVRLKKKKFYNVVNLKSKSKFL